MLTTTNRYLVQLYKLVHFLKLKKFKYTPTYKLYSKSSFKKLLEKNGWRVRLFCYEGDYGVKKLPFDFLRTRLLIIASKA